MPLEKSCWKGWQPQNETEFSDIRHPFTLPSCGQMEDTAEVPVPVTVIVPEPQVISSIVVAACRLESSSEAMITPLNSGRIIEVAVVEGEHVQEGEILVELSTDQQYSSAVSASFSTTYYCKSNYLKCGS